ncbi:MAG: hypothetical protein DRQ04_01590 [Candidatus Hydrothermota bacterium]|nr:MAG: hypothetical protein DRQ04_01590 [Candidatus Hydrothermae bacterium]
MRPIALITDFGNSDPYVGIMKGIILRINPQATIVDITNEVTPFSVLEAAFMLESSFSHFPEETIFLAVVDPGVGSARRAIAGKAGGKYIVGPDNGLFTPIYREPLDLYRLPVPPDASTTFHGRDVFAPVAAFLSLGKEPGELGEPIDDPVRLEYPPLRIDSGVIEGLVLHVDRFGNLVTSIRSGLIPAGSFRLVVGSKPVEGRLRKYYHEADKGEIFPIVGSAGYLEISMREGSAAEALSAPVGTPLKLIAG